MKFFALACLLFAVPLAAFGASGGVQLTTVPESPRPGEQVLVKATTIGANAKNLVFRWGVGGVVVAEAVGQTTLALDAPALGKSTEVIVALIENGTVVATESLRIRPARVSLVWEGKSVVPPFYPGKPLVSAQGSGVAVAVPEFVDANGTRIRSSDILYTWSLNGKEQGAASGYGANQFTFKPPFFDAPFALSVRAEARNGLTAEAGELIAPRKPEILIYQTSPLVGVSSARAVEQSFLFTTEEVSFQAYPLYATSAEELTVQWTLNGVPVTIESSDPYLAVFRKTGAGTGSYAVGVTLSHAVKFLERATASFQLTF